MSFQNEIAFQKQNFLSQKGSQRTAEAYRTGKQHRLSCIEISENLIGQPIAGEFVEIGAGTGYFSAYLLANRPHTLGILLECTDEATATIRDCMEAHGVESQRYRIAIDDFTQFATPAPVNYVFAMGAIHHAYALGKTMAQIHDNLQPGGYLIAHEPAFDDFAPREFLQNHYQQRLGIDIKVAEPTLPRHDFFFRECEYRRAAIAAGFDLVAWIRLNRDANQGRQQPLKPRTVKSTLKSLVKRAIGRDGESRARRQQQSQSDAQLHSYLMIFRKPLTSDPWIPHQHLL